jgi:hypothetical protein
MLEELVDRLAEFRHDPLGYARWAYPWGEPGPLREATLRTWQQDYLGELGEKLRADPHTPIRFARASGHGIGKSALVSIVTNWAFNTCARTRGVVTANTENQLKTRTWVEMQKWHRLSIAAPLSKFTATAIFSADSKFEREWRIDMTPWSEHNTEAFAGLHNEGSRILLVMDEGSAIPDVIWEVAEGALTDKDTEILWLVFGNPTRNTGRFRDCAPDGKFGRRWNFRAIDSRDVEGTNVDLFREWAEDYGEDSDFFKVRVRGQFPDADGDSFISRTDAVAATARRPEADQKNPQPLVLGVDCARFGGDLSVILPRRGRDARSIKPKIYQGLDAHTLTLMIRDTVNELGPEGVFIDEGNIGAAVVDNLRAMRLPTLILGVNFGSGPGGLVSEECLNKRAELWVLMRQWLRDGGMIPEYLPGAPDRTFVDELVAPTMGYASKVRGRSEALQLESKKDIRRRVGFSPDFADALACTFHLPLSVPANRYGPLPAPVIANDYDPLNRKEHPYGFG